MFEGRTEQQRNPPSVKRFVSSGPQTIIGYVYIMNSVLLLTIIGHKTFFLGHRIPFISRANSIIQTL